MVKSIVRCDCSVVSSPPIVPRYSAMDKSKGSRVFYSIPKYGLINVHFPLFSPETVYTKFISTFSLLYMEKLFYRYFILFPLTQHSSPTPPQQQRKNSEGVNMGKVDSYSFSAVSFLSHLVRIR